MLDNKYCSLTKEGYFVNYYTFFLILDVTADCAIVHNCKDLLKIVFAPFAIIKDR